MSGHAGRVGHSRTQKNNLTWVPEFAVSIDPIVQYRRPAVLLLKLNAPGVIFQLPVAWRPVVFQEERDEPCGVIDAGRSNPPKIGPIDS